jgi:hypothetical protein
MKKFNIFLVLFAMLSSVAFSQAYLKPVGWYAYPDNDWSDGGIANKKFVKIMHSSTFQWDSTAVVDNFDSYWDAMGDVNNVNTVSNTAPGSGLVSWGTDFGASWKAFYTNDALYLMIKYLDANQVAGTDPDTRGFENAFATEYWKRFEPQYAAFKDSSNKVRNTAYERFINVGGVKAKVDFAGLHELA